MHLDLTESENATQTDAYANVYTLAIAIHAQRAAIILSKNVLYNFLYRKEYGNLISGINSILKRISFWNNNWDLYELINPSYFKNSNELFILIPKTQKNLFNNLFNFNNMRQLSDLPNTPSGSYNSLINRLAPTTNSTQSVKLMQQDFNRLFKGLPTEKILSRYRFEIWDENIPIVDIYLSGHGAMNPTLIANLNPDELGIFLTFLNTKLKVGMLIINSCYTGGQNICNFKFIKDINQDKILYPLNFVVVVEGVSDTVTYAAPFLSINTGENFFVRIFDLLQQFGKDKSHSLNNLLQELGLVRFNLSALDCHSNIPQIILPGGIEIQSLTPNNNVIVLGNIKVRTAELEKKSLYILPKKTSPTSIYNYSLNVLLYPQTVNTEVIVQSSHIAPHIPIEDEIKTIWEHLPTLSDLITKHQSLFVNLDIYSVFKGTLNIKTLSASKYLYPTIISMMHGNGPHYIKKLVFEGNARDGSGGILMGIRDSFSNISQRKSTKTFYIDTLEGPNDISLILKSIQVIEGNFTQPHLLEQELVKMGEKVTLHNVIISISGTGGLHFTLMFQVNDTAWHVYYDKNFWASNQKLWNFNQNSIDYYQAIYQEGKKRALSKQQELDNQKPLIDILKEKQTKYKALKQEPTILPLINLSSNLSKLADIYIKQGS